MIISLKSFPKLQIIFLFFLISFISCSEETSVTIDNEKFIEIYARLLIIYEMEISKEYHDRLIDELFRVYNTTPDQIDSTLSYLNENPEKWVTTLEKVRNRIQELRKELAPDEKVPEGIPRGKRSAIKEPVRSKQQKEAIRNQENKKRSEKFKARSRRQEVKKDE